MATMLDVQEELARLRAENERYRLNQAKVKRITFKVGAKGGLSLYGFGQFPVTLYAEQWLRVLDQEADIRAYIAAHKAELRDGKNDPRFASIVTA